MKQLSWFDQGTQHKAAEKTRARQPYGLAERKRDLGIELVYQHADTDWKKSAATRLQSLIAVRQTLTADDIIEWLDEQGIVTGDTRAIAAILRGAQKAGQITPDGAVKCRRKSRNGGYVTLWRVVKAGA